MLKINDLSVNITDAVLNQNVCGAIVEHDDT